MKTIISISKRITKLNTILFMLIMLMCVLRISMLGNQVQKLEQTTDTLSTLVHSEYNVAQQNDSTLILYIKNPQYDKR